ncbi:MAG: WYL domain-containing protein [Akkermansiaceae bacterium]|nr:WYL domain-containing protein [Akkermansiaceae bacterium]
MGNTTNEMNWAARERLRAVEVRLWWRGYVGRKELMEVFGISAAQATSDLQKYFELNEGACFYSTKRKRYEAVQEMRCVMHDPILEEGLSLVFGEMVGDCWQRERVWSGGKPGKLGVVKLPLRKGEARVERVMVLAAGRQGKVRVKYVSVKSGKSRWREMVPRTFGWDGRRWHARAYCLEKQDWRDFVLGRIAEAEWPEGEKEVPADEAWDQWGVLRLRINPELDVVRRRGVRMDYGLESDLLEIRVREAMKPYLLAEMFLEDESEVDAPRHFIVAE